MAKSKATARKPRRAGTRRKSKRPAPQRWGLVALEVLALVVTVLVVDLGALGWSTARFQGDRLFQHVLPFALTTLGIAVITIALPWAWLRLRRLLDRVDARLPVAVAILAAGGATLLVATGPYRAAVGQLRLLTDGPGEARRTALAHQVWASYRRADVDELGTLLERGRVYETTIDDAAAAFDLSTELMMGIAATESSFHPRPSKDGGRGLFQITAVPDAATANAKAALDAADLDRVNQRHNAFIGAATFRIYLDQMQGDPFLALLAYNIGPHNGGLLSIMDQYGARDFVTIQPYLKHLPRDYPIRVLTHALAYRIWKRDGKLLPYQEGTNAAYIQRIGIPGLTRADR